MENDEDPELRKAARSAAEHRSPYWDENSKGWSHEVRAEGRLAMNAPAIAAARDVPIASVRQILNRFSAGALPNTAAEQEVAWELHWLGVG